MPIPCTNSAAHPLLALNRRTARHLGASFVGVSLALSMGSLATVAAAADSTPEPAVALAPPPAEAKKKAMAHFETGLKLYEDSDFSLALIEFERAYSYVPDYRVLYNIGQVSVQLGRYARAVHALRQYLQAGGSHIPAARMNSVRDDLKMLEGRTAHLAIDCNVEGAEILLDDVPIGLTPIREPLLVDAGEHRLSLQKPGYVSRTERLVLAGRDESKLQLDLNEVPKAVAAPSQQIAPLHITKIVAPDPPKPMSTRTQLLYAGAGMTGLLVAAWGVTGYIGIRAAGDLNDALQRPSSLGELEALRNKARGALIASDILGAAALATGATTLYFTLKGPSPERPKQGMARVAIGFAPSAVQVSGAFY